MSVPLPYRRDGSRTKEAWPWAYCARLRLLCLLHIKEMSGSYVGVFPPRAHLLHHDLQAVHLLGLGEDLELLDLPLPALLFTAKNRLIRDSSRDPDRSLCYHDEAAG